MQLAREDAERWVATSNLVATTLLLAMGGFWDGGRRLFSAADAFQKNATDEEVTQLFPLFVEVGRLTSEEEESIMSYLATMPKPRLLVKIEKLAAKEGLRKGLEQGIRASKLEDARRMLARGCDWAFITDITGLRPEDLDVPA